MHHGASLGGEGRGARSGTQGLGWRSMQCSRSSRPKWWATHVPGSTGGCRSSGRVQDDQNRRSS